MQVPVMRHVNHDRQPLGVLTADWSVSRRLQRCFIYEENQQYSIASQNVGFNNATFSAKTFFLCSWTMRCLCYFYAAYSQLSVPCLEIIPLVDPGSLLCNATRKVGLFFSDFHDRRHARSLRFCSQRFKFLHILCLWKTWALTFSKTWCSL